MNVIERLPPAARERLSEFEDAESAAQALVTSTMKRIDDLTRARTLIHDQNVQAVEVDAEIARLRGKMGRYQADFANWSQLCGNVRIFLATQATSSGATFVISPPVRVTLGRDQTAVGAIASIRADIANEKAELRATRAAVLPASDLKANARAHIEALVRKGTPRISHEHEPFALDFRDLSSVSGKLDIAGILAWYDTGRLIDRVEAEIDAMTTTRLQLTPAEKAERIEALEGSLLSCEQQEEAVIRQAYDEQGLVIARRPDANPAVLLGVKIANAAQSRAA